MTPHCRNIAPSNRTLCYLRRILYSPLIECRPPCVRPAPRRHVHCSRVQFAGALAHATSLVDTPEDDFSEKSAGPRIRSSRIVYVDTPPFSSSTLGNTSVEASVGEKVVPSSQLPPVHPRTCLQWISMKKYKEATYWWRHARERGVSEEWVTKVASSLFRSLNENKRHNRVPKLFTRLARVRSSIDTACLNACLEAFLLGDRPERVVSYFNQYRYTPIVDYQSYELTMRALVELRDLKSSEELLRELVKTEFSLSPSACAILLDGVREQTRSTKEMERLFEWMRTLPIKKAPIYNIMIEEALMSGNIKGAKEYIQKLQADGLNVNAKSLGILIVLQAKTKDWDAVALTLSRLKERKLRLSTYTFNILLAFYSRAYGVDNIESFFDTLIRQGVPADSTSYNILIRAFLIVDDTEGAFRWLDNLKATGLPAGAEVFNTFFHYLVLNSAASTSVLRRLYGAVYEWDSDVVDNRTRELLELRVRGLSYPLPSEDQEAAYQEISGAIQANEKQVAIDMFRQYLAIDAFPAVKTVKAIIKLCYDLPEESLAEARALLRVAQARGIQVDRAIVSAMADSVRNEAYKCKGQYGQLLKMVLAAYDYMEENSMAISHHVTVAALQKLLRLDDPVGVVFIANEVFKTPWSRRLRWPLELLDLLLRAYISLVDINGVQWVVERLVTWSILPDRTLCHLLRHARTRFKSPETRSAIVEAWKRCERLREAKREESHEEARKVLKATKDQPTMSVERERRHKIRKGASPLEFSRLELDCRT